MKKLVIFDLDGVLVDACEWHRVALNSALIIANYEISLSDHLSKFNGLTTRTKLEMLAEEGHVKRSDFELIFSRKQEATLELIQKQCLYDYVKTDALRYLGSRNISRACVTNSIRQTAQKMLVKTGLMHELDFLVTNEDVPKKKPFIDGLEITRIHFDLYRKDCLVLDDLDICLDTAKRAGYTTHKINAPADVNTKLFQDIF